MKYLLVFIVFLFTSVSVAEAQFSKGSFMVGGGFSVRSVTYKSTTATNLKLSEKTQNMLSFTPRVGYFITNGLAVGTGFSFSRSEYPGFPTQTDFMIAPFIRGYYHRFFAQGSFNYETNAKLKGIDAGIGYAFLLNKNVAIEPQLTYGYSSDTGSEYVSGIYLSIAIQFYIPGK